MKTTYNRNPILLRIAQMLNYYDGVDNDYELKCRTAYEAGDWDMDNKEAVLNKIKDELLVMDLENMTTEDIYRRTNMLDAWYICSVNFYLYKQKSLEKIPIIIDEFFTIQIENPSTDYPKYEGRVKYFNLVKTLINDGVENGRQAFKQFKNDTEMGARESEKAWYVEDCEVAMQAFESWKQQ